MGQRQDSPHSKLPFEPHPDIQQNRHDGQGNRDKRRLDQLSRYLWPDGFDRRERDIWRHSTQRILHSRDGFICHAFFAGLGLNTDHGHVLIGLKARIEYFGDGYIAKL